MNPNNPDTVLYVFRELKNISDEYKRLINSIIGNTNERNALINRLNANIKQILNMLPFKVNYVPSYTNFLSSIFQLMNEIRTRYDEYISTGPFFGQVGFHYNNIKKIADSMRESLPIRNYDPQRTQMIWANVSHFNTLGDFDSKQIAAREVYRLFSAYPREDLGKIESGFETFKYYEPWYKFGQILTEMEEMLSLNREYLVENFDYNVMLNRIEEVRSIKNQIIDMNNVQIRDIADIEDHEDESQFLMSRVTRLAQSMPFVIRRIPTYEVRAGDEVFDQSIWTVRSLENQFFEQAYSRAAADRSNIVSHVIGTVKMIINENNRDGRGEYFASMYNAIRNFTGYDYLADTRYIPNEHLESFTNMARMNPPDAMMTSGQLDVLRRKMHAIRPDFEQYVSNRYGIDIHQEIDNLHDVEAFENRLDELDRNRYTAEFPSDLQWSDIK